MPYDTKDLADPRPLRQEMYLAALHGLYEGELPLPVTREDAYLYVLAVNAQSGAGSLPELAEDGSDADKFVKTNSDGTGYELVSMTNVAEEGA